MSDTLGFVFALVYIICLFTGRVEKGIPYLIVAALFFILGELERIRRKIR